MTTPTLSPYAEIARLEKLVFDLQHENAALRDQVQALILDNENMREDVALLVKALDMCREGRYE